MIIQQAVPPTKNYTKNPNAWIRDRRLSPGAHGVRDWLASHRTGFRITEKTIVSAFNCGRTAIRRMIKELLDFGYLIRQQRRSDKGRWSEIDYIVTDPWAAAPVPAPEPVNEVAEAAADETPWPVAETPEATEESTEDVEPEPVQEIVEPQVATVVRSSDVGQPPRIRRPEPQKTRTTKTKNQNQARKTAVGDVTDRNARDAVTTPPADSKSISRMAGVVLGKLPAHYRDIPYWVRRRLHTKIETALHAGNSPQAIVVYAAKFLHDGRFNQYEHLVRFDDVVRKLTEDVAYDIACSGCGRDPQHSFCAAEIDGGF